MLTRRTTVLLLLAGAILLSQKFLISLIAQDRTRLGQTRVATEPNDNESGYTLTSETPYYKTSPQQGRAPDGKFAPGTKVNLLKRGGPYSLVQSANGIRVYVSTDVLHPAQEAEGKNLPITDAGGKREAGAGRKNQSMGLATVKVGVFNNAASGKLLPTTIKTPNIPTPPKPLNMSSKINLLKSSIDFTQQFPGLDAEASRRQGLYSRLTPAQPKNEKGYLSFYGVRTAICDNFDQQSNGAISSDGYTFWHLIPDIFLEGVPEGGLSNEFSQGAEPTSFTRMTITHRAQPGRMYLFDISITTVPDNKPITINDGTQTQTIASNNGHLLVVVKAIGDITRLSMLLTIGDPHSYYDWYFYSCEVTELQ
jgi:hypothetical protein